VRSLLSLRTELRRTGRRKMAVGFKLTADCKGYNTYAVITGL
jgi:hypothetical protein